MGNKGSFKFHIGYRHKNKALVSPLNIKLSQLTGYTKHFDNNNNNNNKPKKSLFKKEFDEKTLHNNKHISTKIKIYNDTIHTEFKYKIIYLYTQNIYL